MGISRLLNQNGQLVRSGLEWKYLSLFFELVVTLIRFRLSLETSIWTYP